MGGVNIVAYVVPLSLVVVNVINSREAVKGAAFAYAHTVQLLRWICSNNGGWWPVGLASIRRHIGDVLSIFFIIAN